MGGVANLNLVINVDVPLLGRIQINLVILRIIEKKCHSKCF